MNLRNLKESGSYQAIMLMLGSGMLMASVAACVKYLSDDFPVPEILFFRNITGAIIILFILRKRGVNPLGVNRKVLLLRGIVGTLGVFFYFYAISSLTLADAVMLNRTSPFFVIILSSLFLREKMRKLQIPALIIAMLGILLIARPRLDYSFLPAAVGLMSAFFAGAAYTTLRHLRHSDTPFVIVFYFTMVSSLSMVPIMAFGYWETPDPAQLGILISMGLLGLGGQHLMTNAYRHAQAGEVAIYGYSSVIFAMLLGIIIWWEIPNLFSITGAAAIIFAAYLNARAGFRSVSRKP